MGSGGKSPGPHRLNSINNNQLEGIMSNQRIISNSPNLNGSVSQRSLGSYIQFSPNQQKAVNNMPMPSGMSNNKYQNQLYKNVNDIIIKQ